VTHKVENFDRWRAVFDSVNPAKRNYGWKQSNVFSIDGDKNDVMVMEEYGSIEKAKGLFAIRTEADVAHALWLFQLSYDRRRGLEQAELLARITDYVARDARSSARRKPRAE
jgi:hypothetical protein